MLMMNSFVIKHEQRTKFLSAEIFILIIEEEEDDDDDEEEAENEGDEDGKSSKQTLVFFSLFLHVYYSSRSFTSYARYLLTSVRSNVALFFLSNLRRYRCAYIYTYIYRLVHGCARDYLFQHKTWWDISSHLSYMLNRKDIFGYTTGNEKGQTVTIFLYFFQIFLISQLYLQLFTHIHKQCQTINKKLQQQLLLLLLLLKVIKSR